MNQLTIVYEVTDERAFREGGNPLRYRLDGLQAHKVALFDAVDKSDALQAKLERLRGIVTPIDRKTVKDFAALLEKQNLVAEELALIRCPANLGRLTRLCEKFLASAEGKV